MSDPRTTAYTSPRQEVADLVPVRARSILELGCSTGATARVLAQRQPLRLVGVDNDPAFTEEARGVFDQVLEADLNDPSWADSVDGPFDCIIAADVLEHLVDPWTTVRAAVALLDEDGCVILSIPNVRHLHNVVGLLLGKWPYRDRGLHDSTHLRFFTLREIEALCAAAGLRPESVHRKPRLLDHTSRWDRLARWAARTPMREFFTFQYIVRATRAPESNEPAPESVPGWVIEARTADG